MSVLPRLVLKPEKEQSIFRRHPWIFSGAIQKLPKGIKEGDVVELYSSKNEYLATGHYQNDSIAVKLFAFEPTQPDTLFWTQRVQQAWDYRTKALGLGTEQTNAFRLVHGEGDNLPGLIVDYYHGHLVLQAHSAGMYYARHELLEAFKQVLGQKLLSVYDKSEKTLPFKAQVGSTDGYLMPGQSLDTVRENGLAFRVDWEAGQKTGFFLDQRENRQLLAHYSQGRRVLNLFGYTGGFSVYALAGGATEVHTVDASEKAVAMARTNVALNFGPDAPHEAFAADAFDYLRANQQRYDLIVLDPPAFAKHKGALNNALQGYKRLNQLGIEQVRPGGIVFTFSCSQAVSKDEFRKSVFAAAANSRRNVRVLHQLTQPADHPVSIYHPEGEYLKGLVLYVE